MNQQDDCIFCKIINQQIPAKLVFEDEQIIAFHDIHPKADIHFLIVPKKHIESLINTRTEDKLLLGHMLTTGNKLAMDLGLEHGYKVAINCGIKGGQEVLHLHIHFLGNK